MPPSISMVHVDQALTNVSIAFSNEDLVADLVSPRLPVDKQSNKYFQFDMSAFRQVDDRRSPGAEANEAPGWELSKDLYFCDGHGLKDYIPDETRSESDPAVDIEVNTTERLTELMLLNREIALQQLIFGAGSAVPNTALSGTSQWSDFTDSDPIVAVDAQKEVVLKGCTKIPNTLLLSFDVFQKVRNHPSVIDRVKYVEKADQLNEQDLASAFGVGQVIVAKGLNQTSHEGQADALDYIWKNSALLFYRPPAIGLRVISLSANFRWTYGVPKNQGNLVKRYRVEQRTADAIEAQMYYDDELIVPAAGYAWTNVIA